MRFVALVSLFACALGCDSPVEAPPPAQTPTAEAVSEETLMFEARIASLERTMTDLRVQLFDLSLRHPTSVIISPADTGYQSVTTGVSTFLVTLMKVAPYANGQRLTFRIGNPQSIQYADPVVRLKWGPRKPELAPGGDPRSFLDAMDAWRTALRSKEERLFKRLHPGVWNEVVITVAPATSEEIGHVEFAMDVASVSMSAR